MTAKVHHPPSIINKYLAAKVDERFGTGQTTYFFPTLPTDLESLTQTFPDTNGLFGVYDRMFRMRRVPFPYIKCEQVLYYFYATGNQAQGWGPSEQMVYIQQMVSDLLDSGDDSAKDINDWAAANPTLWGTESKPLFFHNFKIYQLEEARDIVDFGTARTYAGNKIIIDYDWHPVNP
jgi:hypothetical protein